jgi:hypothetical protein
VVPLCGLTRPLVANDNGDDEVFGDDEVNADGGGGVDGGGIGAGNVPPRPAPLIERPGYGNAVPTTLLPPPPPPRLGKVDDSPVVDVAVAATVLLDVAPVLAGGPGIVVCVDEGVTRDGAAGTLRGATDAVLTGVTCARPGGGIGADDVAVTGADGDRTTAGGVIIGVTLEAPIT